MLSRSERLLSEPSRWYSCLVQYRCVAAKYNLAEPEYWKYATRNNPIMGGRDDLDKLMDIVHDFLCFMNYTIFCIISISVHIGVLQ